IVGTVDGNRLWRKDYEIPLVEVEWSPDGRYILFGSKKGDILIVESSQGNLLSKMDVLCIEKGTQTKVIGIDWYAGGEGYSDLNAPTLAICFENGRCQLMTSEIDEKPVLIDTHMRNTKIKWNTFGTVLAIAGVRAVSDRNVTLVQFYNPYGQHLRTLKLQGNGVTGLSWEGTGLRIALAIDHLLYFANVRPEYKWG